MLPPTATCIIPFTFITQERIIAARPHELLVHMSKLKDAVDYLSNLTPPSASHLLRCLVPVIDIDHQKGLRDYIIIVLRKAIFSRETKSRRIAVSGFLTLIER